MKRSKKIFLILAGIFILIMLVIAFDMSQRTTFPGAKPKAVEPETEIEDIETKQKNN